MGIFEELSKQSPEKVEFIQDDFISSDEWKEVKEISSKIYSYITSPEIKRKIDTIKSTW